MISMPILVKVVVILSANESSDWVVDDGEIVGADYDVVLIVVYGKSSGLTMKVTRSSNAMASSTQNVKLASSTK